MNNIKVKDITKPEEIIEKHKPWLGKLHTFPSVKVETPPQPTNLNIHVGDSSITGEKIG